MVIPKDIMTFILLCLSSCPQQVTIFHRLCFGAQSF